MKQKNNLEKNTLPGRRLIELLIALVVIIAIIFAIESSKSTNITSGNSTIDLAQKSKRAAEKSLKYEPAKELVLPDGYINTNGFPITISENIGKKVILVDFWTYTCINCKRTTPYLNAWHEKYAEDGLLIIGVHTPEFDFEKNYDNVKKATDDEGILYPVVLDNNYLTWNAYNNKYWPRKYLIDIDGFIVYDHIGEGGYDETESKIKEALMERVDVLNEKNEINADSSSIVIQNTDFSKIKTPELYFGYDFYRGQLGNKEGLQKGKEANYTLLPEIQRNLFYLNGVWKSNADNMESVSAGNIILAYSSRDVNIVAGAKESVSLKIFLDGKYKKEIVVYGFDLYSIISEEEYGEHLLEIQAPPGLMIYTFTFG